MHTRRWLAATLAGLGATILFVSLANSILILGHVQEFLAGIIPRSLPELLYSLVVDWAVAICIALPGLVVAVVVMAP